MNERLNAIVGAKIAEFKKKMAEVRGIASQFSKDDATKDINADISDFKRDLNEAKAKIATFASTDANKSLDLDKSRFTRKLTAAQVQTAKFTSTNATKDINADTSDLTRGVAQSKTLLASIKDKWVNVRVRHQRFRKDMDRIADAFRDINVVGAEMGKGLLGVMIPAFAVIAAGATGALATAGVQVGVLAGGLMGLMSSFSVAALGAVGLGAVMIPTIKRISEANTAIKNGEASLSDYSKPMQVALKGLFGLQKAYKAVNKAVEPYVLRASGTAMSVLGGLLTAIQPGIVGVAKAFEGLMIDLKNVFANAEDVKASISWFNKRAGSAVEAWAKIAGYAFRGFINLMRAFDPLAKDMEAGLLNMTKRFSEWADGLSRSEKFEKFIQYVRENGPKLMSVFGNITTGLVNMFVAFAPLAADMMTGFQKMTARFKEWSANLSNNEGFKNFVNYIRENGPQMRELIANIVDVGVELAKALGRVGEVMIPVINNILSFTASFLKANPVMGNIIVGLASMMGAFKLFAPVIATFRLLFGGAFGFIWKAFVPFRTNMIVGLKMLGSKLGLFAASVAKAAGKVIVQFVKMAAKAVVWAAKMAAQMVKVIAKYAWLGAKALLHAGKVAASWVIAMGPVGWVIATVVALVALIIANWDEVKKWTKKAWTATVDFVKEAWQVMWAATKAVASAIWEWVKGKWDSLKSFTVSIFNAVKDFLSSVWNSIKSTVSSVVSAVVSFIKTRWDNFKSNTMSVFNAVKSFLSSVWSGIKSIVSNVVTAVVNFVKTRWNNLKSNTMSVFNAVKSFINSVWNSIKSFISNVVSNIKETVSSKFQALKDAVAEKMEAAKTKIESVWNRVVGFFEGIDLYSIGQDIIQGLIDGIGDMFGSIKSMVEKAANLIPDWLKKKLGIASPSKVTMQIGAWTGEGLAKGMNKTLGSVKSGAKMMAQAAIPHVPSMSPATPSLASVNTPSYGSGSMDGLVSNAGTTNNNTTNGPVTINIYDAEDDTVKEIKQFFGTFEQSAKQM